MKQIKGKRIELRERTNDDLIREKLWLQDPESWLSEGLIFPGFIPLLTDDNLFFSVYTEEEHIGIAGYFPEDRDCGEVGILIGNRQYRGKGYGQESIGIFCKYLFDELSIKYLYCCVKDFNIPALKVALKSGFAETKRLIRNSPQRGMYEDIFLKLSR